MTSSVYRRRSAWSGCSGRVGLTILVSNFEQLLRKRILPRVLRPVTSVELKQIKRMSYKLDGADIIQYFGDDPRSSILVLHLLSLKLRLIPRDRRSERHRENHDRYTDQHRPTEQLIK